VLYYNVLALVMSSAHWKAGLHSSLWWITVDDSLQMNRYQSLKVIIQDEGRKKLAAANFGSLWVTHRK
jgi:hypothetical protein